jgi:uncharacterized protein
MKRTALVTGASGGIGLELTRLFAGDGHDLVLVARSEAKLHEIGEQLQQAHGITATVIASDLSRPTPPATSPRPWGRPRSRSTRWSTTPGSV